MTPTPNRMLFERTMLYFMTPQATVTVCKRTYGTERRLSPKEIFDMSLEKGGTSDDPTISLLSIHSVALEPSRDC